MPAPVPATVRTRNALDSEGKSLHFLMNFTSQPARLTYPGPAAEELLSGRSLAAGQAVQIGPWDLLIARDTGSPAPKVKKR